MEAILREHEKKLEDYKNNPDAYDNLGFLAGTTDPVLRQKIIDGRIRNLQRQIDNFRRQLEECRKKNP